MASSATAVPIGLALKVEWVEPGGKIFRVDQLLARPHAGERIEAVGDGLAEHDDVGLHAEVLDRPQLAGAIEAHLDFVDDQQDAVLVEHALQLDEIVRRRNDVAARALDRLDVEGGILGLAGLRVPHAVVLALEQPLELLHAVVAVLLLAHALGAAEVIRKRHEMRAVAEVAVAAAIAVGRGDRRGAERAAVIAALEREHQALALLEVAHELEAVLDRLAAADVEMHAALGAELARRVAADVGRKLDLLAMQVLACHLRQAVELAPHRLVEARIGVAEVDRGVPHLQVEVRAALHVVDVGAFAALEDLRWVGVVHRVAVRAIQSLEGEQLLLLRQRARSVAVYASCTHRSTIIPAC